MVDSDASRSSTGGPVIVGIPSYNRRDETKRAVVSALDQDGVAVRVVVSDNGSDDGTAEMLRDLACAYPEVELLLHAENVGPTVNFERLRPKSADGAFMWLGDDDWLGPGALHACAELLRDDPTVVTAVPAVRYHGTDGEWIERPAIDLADADRRRRVLEYFRQVSSNGAFYGLTRTSALAQVPPVSNLMGGDWTHVAALAFLGKLRTVEGVELHRSIGGATRSLADVARHLQLGWLPTNAPQIAIAGHVLAEIGWRSRVYDELGRADRVVLGSRAALIILRRFLPGAIARFVRLHGQQRRSTMTGVVGDEVIT